MRILRALVATLRLLAGSIAGAAWLLALYGGTAWIAIGTLGAIQIREQIQSDKKITFAKLDSEEQKVKRRLNDQYENLEPKWSHIDDLQESISHIEQSKYEEELRAIKDLEVFPKDIGDDDKIAWIKSTCSQSDLAKESNIPAAVCADMTGIDKNSEEKMKNLTKEITLAYAELDALYGQIDQEEQSFQESVYADLIPDWTFMNDWGYRTHLTMPNQILILVLTMAMGALGSVVTLTWSFINRDSGFNFRRYLLLPFVGAISAFIIFVFLKAGQITITSGDQTDPLDPFFLSFVGIISGLLSERAYTRIASVGRNFFRTEEDEERRWGVRLGEAVAAAGVSPADLAAYVAVDENEVERLVNEKASATLQQQRLIAACLRRSVRDIFTDIAPDADQDLAEDVRLVAVPDLVGKDVATLEQDLAAARLALGATDEVADSEHPPGRVVAQTPPAGARVAANSTVDVTFSSGPAP